MIVGAPCLDRPPTVVVTVEGGGRRIIVGGQLALDKDGNVVGKGDMAKQIEQVAKNLEVCLKTGGANTSDILVTRTYVADMAAFLKHADICALSWPRTRGQHDGRVAKIGGVRFPRRDRGGAAVN